MDEIPLEEAARKRKRKRSPVGAPPGTLIADPTAPQPSLSIHAASAEGCRRFDTVSAGDIARLRQEWPLIWLDCVGLGDVDLIREIGAQFGLHPLALEDVVNTGQRPKADFYDTNVFVVLSMVDDAATHRTEQVSIFFGEGFVITFQERAGDSFDPVRKRLHGAPGRLHSRGADFLAYSLIDTIVDSYFPVLEGLGDRIDQREDEILTEEAAGRNTVLHGLRRVLLALKRSLWPMRDALAGLARAESRLLKPETRIYLNDTLDHATQLLELLETYRETVTDLIDLQVSMGQARINQVISLLTIVTAIFIPLTFLVGVWGMNFDPDSSPWNMPELRWEYGYPAALLFMLFIALSLLAYFRWRRWL
jgi:magnesium transporter